MNKSIEPRFLRAGLPCSSLRIEGYIEVLENRLVNDKILSIRSIDNRYRYRIVIDRPHR
jgi:hypothetical protein